MLENMFWITGSHYSLRRSKTVHTYQWIVNRTNDFSKLGIWVNLICHANNMPRLSERQVTIAANREKWPMHKFSMNMDSVFIYKCPDPECQPLAFFSLVRWQHNQRNWVVMITMSVQGHCNHSCIGAKAHLFVSFCLFEEGSAYFINRLEACDLWVNIF